MRNKYVQPAPNVQSGKLQATGERIRSRGERQTDLAPWKIRSLS